MRRALRAALSPLPTVERAAIASALGLDRCRLVGDDLLGPSGSAGSRRRSGGELGCLRRVDLLLDSIGWSLNLELCVDLGVDLVLRRLLNVGLCLLIWVGKYVLVVLLGRREQQAGFDLGAGACLTTPRKLPEDLLAAARNLVSILSSALGERVGKSFHLQHVEQSILTPDNLVEALGDAGADDALLVPRAAADRPGRSSDARLAVEWVVAVGIRFRNAVLGVGVNLEGLSLNLSRQALQLVLLGARLPWALLSAEQVARDRIDVFVILIRMLLRGSLGWGWEGKRSLT